ncbi:MAG: hypothetical protein V7L01_11065 [Nostoc sp.]|uniref:hypothetical protein n=1 Tax=Nostoc sp. TaxID=1180 RepID=UPI002FF6F175
MGDRNIIGTLSPEDIQEIKAALQIIEQKMPFLIALTAQERRKLFKMGDSVAILPGEFRSWSKYLSHQNRGDCGKRS